MSNPIDDLRRRLHARIVKMSSEQLVALDALLHRIEWSDPPPAKRPTTEPSHSSILVPARREARSVPARPPVQKRDWPRAPIHRISEQGTYFVTCGTLHKEHHFGDSHRLTLLEGTLLTLANEYGWQLEAWAVFSNHYHFVGHSGGESGSLQVLLKHVHGETARLVNELDGAPERTVWHNFWDTQLTYERSYLARLNYVHQNPVRHRLVRVANQYLWCSAAWFERMATPAQVKTIYGFKIDRVRAPDAFEPLGVDSD